MLEKTCYIKANKIKQGSVDKQGLSITVTKVCYLGYDRDSERNVTKQIKNDIHFSLLPKKTHKNKKHSPVQTGLVRLGV